MLSFDVLIVDDHPVIGMALCSVLESHPAVRRVFFFESASAAIKDIVKRTEDCVVILDVDMPDISGFDFLRLLPKTSMNLIRVLIYTGQKSVDLEISAIRAGAKGLVNKNEGLEGFIQAFECIIKQRTYFNEDALKVALTDFDNHNQRKIARLSAREYAIAKRLAAGETHAHIAEALFISPKTVSAHKGHILEKLEISNIPQLIRILESVSPA